MELFEIRNNLVKLSYEQNDNPVLGKFITLNSQNKSYIAQIINLKSDSSNNFIIARLIFTYTDDGIVDGYDGSIPEITSTVEALPSAELLDLLPVESPIIIGNLTQEDAVLKTDISIFEANFTVFAEHDFEKDIVISNCVRQLFRLKEKSVIFDNTNLFGDYPKLELGTDFKLPLNSELINFIFNYEMSEVDATTKAVIQEILYAVEQYVNSLDDKFLPIEKFINVIASQYKENNMPELALLKNKLIKYKDASIFANEKEDFAILKEIIERKNCVIIGLSNINDSLQNQVMSYVHGILEGMDKFVYVFAPLNDENSDKKLLQRLINNNHIFTTILTSHSYKYASELKDHAQNILFFAPQSLQHDFPAYNTFLNKLNYGEGIIYGKLTQNVPFIIDINDLELDLTKDDVLGDREEFAPVETFQEEQFENNIETSDVEDETEEDVEIELPEEKIPAEELDSTTKIVVEDDDSENSEYEQAPQQDADKTTDDNELQEEEPQVVQAELVPSQENEEDSEEVIEDNYEVVEDTQIEDLLPDYDEPHQQQEDTAQLVYDENEEEHDIEPNVIEPVENILADDTNEGKNSEFVTSELTEDDLDFLEITEQSQQVEESDSSDLEQEVDLSGEEYHISESETPVVPIYSADDETDEYGDIDFEQGDRVQHPRYGNGTIEKIIKYGNKTLCSISFENVGRRLLDPSISEFTKL